MSTTLFKLLGSPVWVARRKLYLLPQRLTLKNNPAIYTWLRFNFSWDPRVLRTPPPAELIEAADKLANAAKVIYNHDVKYAKVGRDEQKLYLAINNYIAERAKYD